MGRSNRRPTKTQLPPWIELPSNVTADILQRLGAEGMLCTAQRVCTTWWKICKDPSLWRVIDFSNDNQGGWIDKYTVMCRCAVDRSQGQLVDFTIQYFGDDDLLEYIVDRSPNLKRLKLGTCFYVSDDGATRMAAKLPQLEELHLTIRSMIISPAGIEAMGKSCPTLTSFSCNGFKYPIEHCDEGFNRNGYALAISKSMPNLRHLQVYAHWMGNEGLEAILNGCPRLKSIDIRRCFDLDLEGDLGKRCRRQIKDLKLPHDSTSDIPWPDCYGNDPFAPFSDEDFSDYEESYNDNFN